ncbi:GumC family protein [Tropicimonas isoalkanivorans]|uniref:non-specific protein-tyrosine kinase n=1 Tax=Tropicimonas isoalkanivorans TaxID=441112 RepID=A0A1I1EER5_9RHOB|nr:polysaccharide biosynthesis tyrosine autokinase [Tropicimonas isoalkanivorans]SFB85649.1 capsular exopolysaccharide family [Tropicimonas isoalkanivorans]
MNQLNRLVSGRPVGRTTETEKDDEIDLRSIFMALWRGRYWILIATVLGLAFGYYQGVVASTPVYVATATIMLEREETPVAGLPSLTAGSGNAWNDAVLKTEMGVIESYNLAEKLAVELDLIRNPDFNPYLPREDAGSDRGWLSSMLGKDSTPQETVAPPPDNQILHSIASRLRRAISVSNQEFSYMLDISVRDTNAQRAALFANTLADLYIRDQVDVRLERTREAREWLSDQTADLKAEADASARRMEAFRGDADLQNEQTLEALNLQFKTLRERAETAEQDVRDLSDKQALIENARSSGSASDQLAAVERVTGRPWSVSVDETDPASVQRLQAKVDTLLSDLSRDLDKRIVHAERLRAALQEQQVEIDQQSTEYVQLRQLEREAEADRLIYEYFLARLKEAAVKEGFAQASARVLSPAFGGRQIGANGFRFMIMSGLMGMVLTCGLLILRDRMNDRYRLSETLEGDTGLPVLGQIPQIPGRSRIDLISYIVGKPGSVGAEAVRGLRTSLQYTSIDSPPRVIIATSSVPGEGKTVTSIALAHHFAGLGKSVLLIEGDVRRRAFSEIFPAPKDKSLLSVLSGETDLLDAVQSQVSLGIDILSSGQTTANPADILASQAFSCLIDVAREAYDFVVIDTPPLLLVPDARVVGQYADTILFMVQWESTRRSQVRDALAQLELSGLSADGLVLTKVDTEKMRSYGHGQRYGAYSGKGANKYYVN